jgi:hypothetical protein
MKEKIRCTEPGCGLIKNAGVHGGSGYEHDFQPPRVDKKRKPINQRSEKMETYYEEVRRPAVAAIQGTPCEARISDEIPVVWKCDGIAVDIHEIVSRRQAGSLPLAVELGTMNVCRRCHNWITEHPKEAHEMGYRMSRKDLGLDNVGV